jgi:hypothetical protein
MPPEGSPYFCADYTTARERFRAAAARRGAALHALPLDARGPDGGALTIDIAWVGPARPRRALIHSCGLHGVEGFAGSAIQLTLLEKERAVPRDGALVLVHVLNPFGMAWLRRVNENNVDLNRNFAVPKEGRDAAPDYRRLHDVLNPASAPRADGFYVRAAWEVMRHGLKPLKQAIAGGQYAYPKGLFYGGERLEQGPSRYRLWIGEHLRSIESVVAIDVHTGLGRWCEESVFRQGEVGESGYHVHGGYESVFEALEHRPRVEVLTQELGSYPALQVLHALREENRWHHYGSRSLDHPTKARLKEMFAPRSARWRSFVLERGVCLAPRFLQEGAAPGRLD